MATQPRGRSYDDWAHDTIQHDKRKPIMKGTAALVGVAIMVLLMLYAFSQLLGV